MAARRPVAALADFGFITPLEEECNALLEALGGEFETLDDANRTYFRKRVDVYEIIVTCLHGMGQIESALATYRLIERWNPAHIILVGIAGGLAKDVHFGDVIVSEGVHYYDLGKQLKPGIEYRPEQFKGDKEVSNHCHALKADKEKLSPWQQRCLKVNAPHHLREVPILHIGLLCSGSLVVASTAKKFELLKTHPLLLATEMEAAGVLKASSFSNHQTQAISIRGISDLADEKKDKAERGTINWREVAKNNAAVFVSYLLSLKRVRPLDIDCFTTDPTHELTAEVLRRFHGRRVPDSYLAFPKFVLPKAALLDLKIEVEALASEQVNAPVQELEVSFRDAWGESHDVRVENSSIIAVNEEIAPEPVGLFARVAGDVESIVFHVSTRRNKETCRWQKP